MALSITGPERIEGESGYKNVEGACDGQCGLPLGDAPA